MKEIKSLTGLRGFAALYVVVVHYFGVDSVEKYTQNRGLKILSNSVSNGYLSVDVFFILSAFVLCLVYEKSFSTSFSLAKYKNFMIKRVIRLYPTYIVALLLCLVISLIMDAYRVIYLQKFLYNAFFLQIFNSGMFILNASWSLCTEFIMYFLFPFIAYLCFRGRSNNKTLALVLYGVAMIAYAFIWLEKESLSYFRGGYSIIRTALGYALGISTYMLYKNKVYKDYWKYMPLLIVVLLFIKNSELAILLLLPILILVLLEKNFIASFFESKFWYIAGLISYVLYLFHEPVFQVFYLMNEKYTIIQNSLVLRGGIFGVVILISYVYYKIIEKPLFTYLKKACASK